MVVWTQLVLQEQRHLIDEVLSWLWVAMMDELSFGIF